MAPDRSEVRRSSLASRLSLSCLLACLLLSVFFLSGEDPATHSTSTFTLALVGDVMLGRGVAQALDGDWEAAFSEVWPWLAQADLALANLESPLTSAPQVSDGYDLRAPPEAVVALRAAGFDAVSLANNHALDAGAGGLRQTIGALQAAGISAMVDQSPGASYAALPVHRTFDAPICHLLAFDDSVVPLDPEVAARAVAAAAARADVVVVSIHWGGEYQAAPGPRQEFLARALAEAGADLIFGHGPHVLQRIEWVGETVVAYSLGNFLFDQPHPADCRRSAILLVTVRGARVQSVAAVPTVTMDGRVRPAHTEDAAVVWDRLGIGRSPPGPSR